jgi:hypothetical protein
MQIWKEIGHYGEIWSFPEFVHAELFSKIAMVGPEDSSK